MPLPLKRIERKRLHIQEKGQKLQLLCDRLKCAADNWRQQKNAPCSERLLISDGQHVLLDRLESPQR